MSRKGDHIKRVGLVFSGGPAPAANAVISSAAISFLEDNRECIGFFHGYSNLEGYHPVTHRLLPDEHYRIFNLKDLSGLRNTRGIVIGTARTNPGKGIDKPADLDDLQKTARLRNVYNAMVDLEIDALISIGGDDTLKTANFMYEFQKHLPKGGRRVQVIHLPKTPEPARRRDRDEQLLHRRDDGPQGRLAVVRCRHRGRGEPRARGRGHPRRSHDRRQG
jgi:6-phosphofructokinase 1